MYLQFSDSAKYADVARSIVSERALTQFLLFGTRPFLILYEPVFFNSSISPVMPFSIATSFKIFGVTDFAVIATSLFYFLLTLFFVFLLAKKIFKNNLVGIFSTLAVGFNYDLINYATSGASESPFIFEIVAATYFVSLKKKWGTVVAFLLLVMMYFTRPQAFIYIAGIILYYLLLNFKTKKAVIFFVIISVLGLLVDLVILFPLKRQILFILGNLSFSNFRL